MAKTEFRPLHDRVVVKVGDRFLFGKWSGTEVSTTARNS